MKKIKRLCFIFMFVMAGISVNGAYANAWGIGGHVAGINGSNMPAYFWFQMDADSTNDAGSGDGNCYSQEAITYDGSYSGTTASSNNKVIYAQVLAAMLNGKWVRISGNGGHTAGTACLAETITTYSQTEE